MKVGTYSFGSDSVQVFVVNFQNVQTVPPGLGSASEDASQCLDLAFVIPGGDVGGALTLSMSWHPVVVSFASSVWNRGMLVDLLRQS